ncbi:MAG TPA: lipoyl(octanoyl) transferase LipB, partial [Polyangiaceae bacterium]|nr:lipoyl(octanoyl) transferase LipB [Polyangiaceae bacterium]
MKPARVVDLSRREYGEVWKLQQELMAARQRGEIEDTLVLVEHPDVITLGRRLSSQGNVVAAGDIPIFEIERGGDVTYHGPGQLVGYPILALDDSERDLHAYLRNLEEGLIGVCADVGLEGRRNPGWTGVWIGERKVASLGIAVRKWVTMHGFALNVATDLSRFA